MQQLQFEASWEKAIAQKDRDEIEQLFQRTRQKREEDVECVVVRIAINHRQHLLVTALIHNFSQKPLQFNHRELQYAASITKSFHIPSLIIPPQTSMPWTFIFTEGQPFEMDGQLKISLD